VAVQDPGLYEAGWTPLMAAAVADRVEVAERLLAAAGPGVAPLVAATNKYGQVRARRCLRVQHPPCCRALAGSATTLPALVQALHLMRRTLPCILLNMTLDAPAQQLAQHVLFCCLLSCTF